MPAYLADLCMDLSRYHGIASAADMDSATFFAVCPRLLRYEDGAARKAMQERLAAEKPARRGASAAELANRADLGARDGWAAVFQVEQRKRAG